jgi:AcrR family transcriptional regulator
VTDMPAKQDPPRRPGRPRSFEDEDVFIITTRLLLEGGIGAVTLQAVARELGLTHQAISQRYASKSGLLTAFFEWLRGRSLAYNEAMRSPISSPLAAIRERFLLGTGAANPEDPVPELYSIPLMLELRRDPEVLARMRSFSDQFDSRLAELLERAQAEGELRPCDSVALADLIFAAAIGGTIIWRMNPSGSIMELMDHYIAAALRPYLTDQAPVWREQE